MKHPHHTIRTAALAVALTIPAALSLAAPVGEIVATRDDQDVHQQFGRDSVYAISTRQPAQTEARAGGDGGLLAGIGAAGASAWDTVTGLFEPRTDTGVQPDPLRYGRAGGYVGTDQLALLSRAGPAPAASASVTTGAFASADDLRYPAATEEQIYGPAVLAQNAPSPEIGTVADQESAPAEAGSVRREDADLATDDTVDTGGFDTTGWKQSDDEADWTTRGM